jgi:hypothetical protein
LFREQRKLRILSGFELKQPSRTNSTEQFFLRLQSTNQSPDTQRGNTTKRRNRRTGHLEPAAKPLLNFKGNHTNDQQKPTADEAQRANG